MNITRAYVYSSDISAGYPVSVLWDKAIKAHIAEPYDINKGFGGIALQTVLCQTEFKNNYGLNGVSKGGIIDILNGGDFWFPCNKIGGKIIPGTKLQPCHRQPLLSTFVYEEAVHWTRGLITVVRHDYERALLRI